MALYIARHGQTDWNVAGRYQARTDVPMNDTGRRQAAALKVLFDQLNLVFALAHCSPLDRAAETARIVLADRTTPLVEDEALMEIDLGEWEGRSADDLIAELGQGYHDWRDGGYVASAPGGETIHDVMARVAPTVTALAQRSRDADVLIVAHQATNMAVKAVVSGDDSTERLRWYRQANHQVDVWDQNTGTFLDRLEVDVSGNVEHR